jgi:peroxiredoxin Q/BCP
MLPLNTKAPDFTLLDEKGIPHTLSAYLGTWVLLYFYPKDDTPGCTKEACMLRDYKDAYKENDLVILGVSKDSSESHEAFIFKYKLPFTLLADTDKKLSKHTALQVCCLQNVSHI